MNTRLIASVNLGTRLPLSVIVSLSLLSAPVAAQGGMGGGMDSGMGGRGAAGPPGAMTSPADVIRTNLDNTNPMKFLLDHKKPLSLTSAQQDTMKRYRKEMEDMQKPVFRELEAFFRQAPSTGRGMGAETGMGRGAGSDMGGEMSGGMGGPPGGGRAGGSGGPGENTQARSLPEPAKLLVGRLTDIQDSYRDRARAQLTEAQRAQSDSIEVVWLAKQRKKN